MSILARLNGVLSGDDDDDRTLFRLQMLADARWRSLWHGLALVAAMTLIALPRLGGAWRYAGAGLAVAACVLRCILAARLQRQVARRDPAMRGTEHLVALANGLVGLYGGVVIALPVPLDPQRMATLLLIGAATPLVANRLLAASPLSFVALAAPLAIGALFGLLNDPGMNTPPVLTAFVIGQVISIETLRAFHRTNRLAIQSTLRERRLIAQQWALFETSQLGIALTSDGRVTRMNARLQNWFARDGKADSLVEELAARTGRTPDRIRALIRRAEARVVGHGGRSIEFPLTSGNLGCIDVQVRRFDPLHAAAGLLWTISDRSADYQHRQSLERDAQRDALTGVLNRRGLMARLSQMLGRDLHTRPLAVLCLDLNGFKPLNDKHGHALGDRVLCTVAQRLQRALRSTDVVARTGGDEFVVVLDPLDDGITAAMVAERLGELIAVPMLLEGVGCQVQAAVGMAVAPADGADAEPLLRRADRAMYEVKRAVSPGRPRSAPQNGPDPRSRH